MTALPRLLIVEDDEALSSRLEAALMDRGFDVCRAGTVAEARRIAAADEFEFVVLDLRLPDGTALELIPVLVERDPATRIVVLTGYGSIATALEAVRLGAAHYLTKPVDVDEIMAAFSPGADAVRPPAEPQPMSLDRVEWEYINRVLMDCDGNISAAARVLGIHRRSLQRKLQKYPSPR
jgi:two-component system response regulator RegA